MNDLPKISIVTVVYNGVDSLEKTILSVAAQEYKALEYIVVDGASTDGTLEIVTRNEKFITRWISEPDAGIYSAMNKAAKMATGEWICFLNSGDLFADSTVVSQVAAAISQNQNADVIYGNIMVEGKKGEPVVRIAAEPCNKHRMYFCHQSAFVKTSLMLVTPFDESLKMSADLKFFKQIYADGHKFIRLPVTLVIYNLQGVSNTRRIEGLRENVRVIKMMDSGFERLKFLIRLFFVIFMLRLRKKKTSNAVPVPLSAVVITFNEERNIERCLLSVKELADEIVVLDSHSTDGTQTICERYGARFVQREWTNYGDAKRYATSLASNDYILSLDADEALSDTLKISVREALSSGNPADAYHFNRLNFIGLKPIHHCGWYPDSKIRLFNRTKALWNKAPIHEIVEPLDKTCKIEHLRGDLLHYSFKSVDNYTHSLKTRLFTEAAARELFSRGKRISRPMLYAKAVWSFFRCFFIKKGFLDGYYGYILSKGAFRYTFLKYHTLIKLCQSKA